MIFSASFGGHAHDGTLPPLYPNTPKNPTPKNPTPINPTPINIFSTSKKSLEENDLNRERINFVTEIDHITLGQGSLTLINGEKLQSQSFQKKKDF